MILLDKKMVLYYSNAMDEKTLKDNISKNLIYYRRMAKYTQAEVAEKLSYSDKSVSKWERGEGVPDIIVLSQLAELYHVSVNDVISPVQKKHPPLQYWNKTLLILLSAGLVLLVAVTVFTILMLVPNDLTRQWLCFVYAVPVSGIVVLTLSAVWKKVLTSFFATSMIIWGIAASIYLTWYFALPNIWLFFAIAGVLQVLAILWWFFRAQIMGWYRGKNKDKFSDKH